jgi:hypothetical protein
MTIDNSNNANNDYIITDEEKQKRNRDARNMIKIKERDDEELFLLELYGY